MEVIQFSASRSLQVQRFQFEIKITDTALLWGEITFALFGCFFLGEGPKGPSAPRASQRPTETEKHPKT